MADGDMAEHNMAYRKQKTKLPKWNKQVNGNKTVNAVQLLIVRNYRPSRRISCI